MHPEIIQGGMGVGVSSWTLAKAVARKGQLGVVSRTALDATLVRHLCAGDQGGTSAEGRRGAMIVYQKNGATISHYAVPRARAWVRALSNASGCPQGTESPVVTWASDDVKQALVGGRSGWRNSCCLQVQASRPTRTRRPAAQRWRRLS